MIENLGNLRELVYILAHDCIHWFTNQVAGLSVCFDPSQWYCWWIQKISFHSLHLCDRLTMFDLIKSPQLEPTMFCPLSTLVKFPSIVLHAALLDAAVVTVGVLEPQTHLRSVFFEVKKLFGVKGSTSLPRNRTKCQYKSTKYRSAQNIDSHIKDKLHKLLTVL